MKKHINKIVLPLLVITAIAVQSFGFNKKYPPATKVDYFMVNSFISSNLDSTKSTKSNKATISANLDSTLNKKNNQIPKKRIEDKVVKKFDITIDNDSSFTNLKKQEKYIHPRDTMKAPDSLRLSDPFKYKYYVAIKDSLTHVLTRDSLLVAGDTLISHKLDSLYLADSTYTAEHSFAAWYNSLSKREKRKYHYEQMLPIKKHRMDSILAAKDSIKAVKDSIVENTPRILETYAFPDSLQYKRITTWTREQYFNDFEFGYIDTTYNYRYNDFPYMRKDVNGVSLGISGSPTVLYDFMKRKSNGEPSFRTACENYGYTPETLPMHNTKTPYTELVYTGSLFADKVKEEDNIRVFTTQNILPELNVTLCYDRFGGGGMLRHEKTDNRTWVVAGNYVGKRYKAHGGYIYNKMYKEENGGIIDNFWIRDTTVDAKEIEVNLTNAENNIKKHTYFFDEELKIPFNFIEKLKEKKLRKKWAEEDKPMLDSIANCTDSVMAANLSSKYQTMCSDREEAYNEEQNKVNEDITTAYIGHNTEYTVYKKMYRDKIDLNDNIGRDYYNNIFYYNPTQSCDSMRTRKLDNKFYIKLQPWSKDAVISNISAGVGFKQLAYYVFDPTYTKKNTNEVLNNSYLYAKTGGRYKDYFLWDAFGKYTYVGDEQNDFTINGNMEFNFYPFRKAKKSPLNLNLHFETSLITPDYYQRHFFSNHLKWDKDFNQESITKLQAELNIPYFKLQAQAGVALLKDNIYYDVLGYAAQNGSAMSVMSFALSKNFVLFDHFHFDHRALFQYSSNKDIIPLPTASLNFRYYAQLDVVKNVMQMQLGANVMFNTKWYIPGYNPSTARFHNQKEEKYGGSPYIDIFANIQWKKASIFVKIENIGMGWPNNSADYFSAHHYIRPQKTLKLGIFWPFYVGPSRNRSVSGKAGSGLSGGSSSGSSSSLGGGLGALKGMGSGIQSERSF